MFRIVLRSAATATLIVAASSLSAQQPSTNQAPMNMEHGTGSMGQGQGGMGQGQGGMGQGQGGMGQGGMMKEMHKMMKDMHKTDQGSGTPPSSAHAPAPQAAPTPVAPQCPAGTAVQMDEKGQHTCK